MESDFSNTAIFEKMVCFRVYELTKEKTGVLGLLYVLFAYSAGIGVMSFINNIF